MGGEDAGIEEGEKEKKKREACLDPGLDPGLDTVARQALNSTKSARSSPCVPC